VPAKAAKASATTARAGKVPVKAAAKAAVKKAGAAAR
jgi:hypothetical protein